MLCGDCRQVVDVLVGSRDGVVPPPKKPLRCPECKGSQLSIWGEARPCPRCESSMDCDPEAPTVLWD